METGALAYITPIKPWEPIEGITSAKEEKRGNEEVSIFKDVFNTVVGQVYSTQQDVEKKQYLLATGQLDDAHTLPIAEAKAALSIEVMISLRNKAMESYNELIKMSV